MRKAVARFFSILVVLAFGAATGLAMTEAYVLAGELQASQGDHVAAFRRYEERLAPLLRTKQQSARRFALRPSPRPSPISWEREFTSPSPATAGEGGARCGAVGG